MVDNSVADIYQKFKCFFGYHDRNIVRAVDYVEDGYWRHYKDDRESHRIPSCTLVEECIYCGDESRMETSVKVVKHYDIPMEWVEG